MTPWSDKSPRTIFLEMTDRWNVFPNVNVLPNVRVAGAYCQFNQVIRLPAVSEEELVRAGAGPVSRIGKLVLPLLAHEQRHFADHLSTVWGRNSLVQLFSAYDARARRQQADFYKVRDAIANAKRAHYSDYYTEYYPAAAGTSVSGLLHAGMTCGFEVCLDGTLNEGRPIIFMRFKAPEGQDLCRTPFSLAALLETRAITAEFCSKLRLIRGSHENVVDAETIMFMSELYTILGNTRLSTYSAAAHRYANVRYEVDPLEAYGRAAYLSGLCLDMPERFFDNVLFPAELWGGIDTTKHSAKELHRRFLGLRDRAYLFLVILHAGRSLGEELAVDDWLNAAAEGAGLPSVATVAAAANDECSSSGADLCEPTLQARLAHLLDYGMTIRSLGPKSVYSFNSQQCPAILTKTGGFCLPIGGLEGDDLAKLQDWHVAAHGLWGLMREFVDACAL